jgi:hypothetical protein
MLEYVESTYLETALKIDYSRWTYCAELDLSNRIGLPLFRLLLLWITSM